MIGNGTYEHAGRLANPPNDATLVAATLRQLGFEVKSGSNLTQREMKQRLRDFGQTLRANGGVGLFYFAGHGVQAKGHNYLVPVEADIQTEADLEDAAVDLNYVLSLMDDAQSALNIVILDACRNNPFARSFRSTQEGLAQVKAPTGTLIAYATAPDSIAADGAGTNSPYSLELVKQMQTSGVLVETMFRRVTEQVSVRTNGKQEPWFAANVKGDFYFSGGPLNSGDTKNSASDTSTSKLDPTAIELSYWESIKSSNDAEDFKSYLQRYPQGQFAVLAQNHIRRLEIANTSSSTNNSNAVAPETLNIPPTNCNNKNKGAWYGTFYKNYKGNPAAQKVAYDAAKKYLGACPDDPYDRQAAFMKKFVDLMDVSLGKANSGKAFQDAVAARNYDDEIKYGNEILAIDPENVDVLSIMGVAGLAQGSLLNESAADAEKAIQLIESGKPLRAYAHDQALAYLNWTIGKSKLAGAPAAIPYFLKSAKLESEVKKNPQLYLDLSAAYETGPRAKLSKDYKDSLKPDQTESDQSKVILENLYRVIDNQIDVMARAAALAPADAKKTIVGDLSALYKSRNKNATDANVTELIANILSKPIPSPPQ